MNYYDIETAKALGYVNEELIPIRVPMFPGWGLMHRETTIITGDGLVQLKLPFDSSHPSQAKPQEAVDYVLRNGYTKLANCYLRSTLRGYALYRKTKEKITVSTTPPRPMHEEHSKQLPLP